LTTKRFYKDAYSHKKSRQIIIDQKGTHFDPAVVDVFLALEDEFNRIRQEHLEDDAELMNPLEQAVSSS
ncbi:MAG: hypothetical protein OES64_12515, partial [Desulfobacteraceae bacterium]|nr:hypothetical protein [Desulfobacteraceae bacterium]